MKILVIHTSAGAGHFKAAEAVYHGLKKYSSHEVVLADALDYTSPFFKKFYRGTYFFLITKVPLLWGFFFWLLDIGWLQGMFRWLRRGYNAFNARHLQCFLQEEQFDCIVATQFFPAEVAAALKRRGRIKSKLMVVITDFDVHRIWLSTDVNIYAVASQWTKEKLKKLGIEEDKITVTGIPTDEKFSYDYDIETLKTNLGLTRNMFTVLIATGSFGIGPIEAIIHRLQGFQIIVVCGHNQALFKRLTQRQYPFVKVLGLVHNMHELMAAADVMVTKPGGLSIAEALVSQLPLIFFNSIPGQETNNVRVLKTHGVGVHPARIQDIVKELETLKSSRDTFLTALKKTKALARPSAVKDIIGLIEE